MTPTPSAQTVTAEHTPTPWVADDGDGQYFIIACEETGDAVAVLVDPISIGGHDILLPRDEKYVKAARGEGLFKLVYSRYAEHKANAAFIVEAVNNHARLTSSLAAASARIGELEQFVSWVETWTTNPISAYSVFALDGLFGMTRDRIAALRAKT